jgi:hypothetical protein
MHAHECVRACAAGRTVRAHVIIHAVYPLRTRSRSRSRSPARVRPHCFRSRAVWPSCPAQGWQAGVDRLYARPNGSPAGLVPRAQPTDPARTIEVHGPYQHGMGFPAVNGNGPEEIFSANYPVPFTVTQTGTQFQNVFISEHGTGGRTLFEFVPFSLFGLTHGVYAWVTVWRQCCFLVLMPACLHRFRTCMRACVRGLQEAPSSAPSRA